jgi:hypothetical protein
MASGNKKTDGLRAHQDAQSVHLHASLNHSPAGKSDAGRSKGGSMNL